MLTKTSIKKPFTVIVMIIVIAIIGGVAVVKMPLDLFPEMDLPYMIVATMVPGGAPEEVEKKVTEPIEENMRQINNVKEVQSISADSVSAVIMELQSGADLTTITQDIDTKLKAVKGSFPSMTMEPIIMKIDPDMMPVMTVAISKTGKTIEESSKDLENVADKIKSVGGVASVSSTGQIENNVFIQVNAEKMMSSPSNMLVNQLSAYLNNPLKRMPEKLDGFIAKNGLISEIINNIKVDPHPIADLLDSMLEGVMKDIQDIPGFDEMKDTMISQFEMMLTPSMVSAILTANNFDMPAGTTTVNGLDFMVKIGDKVEAFDELKHLPAFSIDLREMSLDPTITDKESQEYKDSLAINQLTKLIGNFVKVSVPKVEMDALVDRIVGAVGNNPMISKKMVTDLLTTVFYDYNESEEMYYRDNDVYNYLLGMFYQPITVELSDFAYVYNTNTSSKAHTIINGADGMMLSIYKTPDASVTSVTNGISDLLKDMNKNEGINYIVLSNQGEVTKFMISSIAQNLVLGALFAVLVLLIFLRDWKPTLTVGMSIIVSLVTAFAVMYLCGVTLNLVSMGGLALSVGMLVDNSIVVIENIYRKRNEGVSAIKAAYDGTKQVSGAILSSTITTVIVFLPIIFIEGITKQIFTDLAITITVSLFASLIVALTFVPMISSRMLGAGKKAAAKKESKAFVKMKQGYAKALNFMLDKKWITIVIVTVLFVASIISVFFMDVEFLPNTAMEQITVTAGIDKSKLDEHYAYDEIVSDVIHDIDTEFKKKEYIDDMGVELSAGMSVMGFTMGGGNIMSYVTLDKKAKIKPDEATRELEDVVRQIATKYPDGAVVLGGVNTGGIDVGGMVNSYLDASLLSIHVYGHDIDDMRKAALELEKRFATIGEDVKVDNGLINESREFKLIVDEAKASKYNLTTAQVFLQFFSESVPPTANANINFTNDLGSSDIYIYTTDNNMERWYRPVDENGKHHRMYFKKSDDTAKATKFEERSYDEDGRVVGKVTFELNKGTGVFTSDKKYTYDPETGKQLTEEDVFAVTKYNIDPNDMPIYYDNSKISDFDMITFDVKVPAFGEMPEGDMAMPMAGEDMQGDKEQKESLPIFMLLDPVSFGTGADGGIIYRRADDRRFKDLIDDVNYYADGNGFIRYNYTGGNVDNLKLLDPALDINPRVPEAIKMVYGFNTIAHMEGKRVVQMSLKSPTISNKKLEAEARKIINEFNDENADSDINVSFVGQNRMIADTFKSLILMVVLAVVFIYLVMVAQFQSLKSPFIIMFTIPLALTGSILTLLMAQMPISVFALTGIILLVGIVVNNGIVFVDYVNKLMQSGMPKREALLRTAQDRIRPILMTALTTICSMLISVFDTSMGAAAIKPMAVSVVGGLTYSTLLTLFFVPIMYDVMNRKEKLAVIKFDDDKEDDIEAEMRLSKINDVKEVLEESNTLQMMDESFIANNMSTETPMEAYINEATAGEEAKEDAPPIDDSITASEEVLADEVPTDEDIEDAPTDEVPTSTDVDSVDETDADEVVEADAEDISVEDTKAEEEVQDDGTPVEEVVAEKTDEVEDSNEDKEEK